jgi:hypothetical protein
MQAAAGMGHVAGALGGHPAFSSIRAGTLLVVLLAHLSFMASPFHGAMLEGAKDQGSATATDDEPHHGHASADRSHSHRDCAIQWASSPQPAPLSLLAAHSVHEGIGGCASSIQTARPLPRANGPPSGDCQVLFQVFRL